MKNKQTFLLKIVCSVSSQQSPFIYLVRRRRLFFVGSSPWNVAFSVFEIVPQDWKKKKKTLKNSNSTQNDRPRVEI